MSWWRPFLAMYRSCIYGTKVTIRAQQTAWKSWFFHLSGSPVCLIGNIVCSALKYEAWNIERWRRELCTWRIVMNLPLERKGVMERTEWNRFCLLFRCGRYWREVSGILTEFHVECLQTSMQDLGAETDSEEYLEKCNCVEHRCLFRTPPYLENALSLGR